MVAEEVGSNANEAEQLIRMWRDRAMRAEEKLERLERDLYECQQSVQNMSEVLEGRADE